MTKFRKSLLIFGLLALIIGTALGTFIVLSVTGSLKSEPIGLEFTVEDAEREYNGEPLTATSYYLSDGRIVDGHTPIISFKGEQTEVGEGVSSLDVKIVDADGYDVTGEYAIKVVEGALRVTRYTIAIKLTDRDVIYGGATFGITDSDYEVVGGILPSGHRVSLKIKDEWIENTDSWKNGAKPLTAKDVDVMIFDSNGRNVSKNYLSNLSGSVRLVKRPVTFSPLSAEKTYDGKPLTCTQFTVSKGSLASGHYAEPVFKSANGGNASVTNANEDNPLKVTVDAVIRDVDGNDVTAFYDIESYVGTLTVKRANLTLTAKSCVKEFDGAELTFKADNEPESASGLADGDTVTVEYSGSVSLVGKVRNEIVSHTVSGGGNVNYNVTYVSGELEVVRAKASVVLKDSIKEYDGLPFYLEGANADEADSGDIAEFCSAQLPQGFKLTECELDGILQSAELCNSVYTLNSYRITDETDTDFTDCFEVKIKPAVCRINRRTVQLEQNGELSKEYDGNFTFASGIGFDSGLAKGHILKSFTVTAFSPENGTQSTVGIEEFTLTDETGRDVRSYYDIKNFSSFAAQVSISKKPLAVSTLDYSKEYDGISVGGDLTYGLLASGDRLVITNPVSVVNCTPEEGVPNEPEFAVYNSSNQIVSCFYDFTGTFGTIKITKKSVLVSLEYCEIEYSGIALSETALSDKVRCDAVNPNNFIISFNGDTIGIGEKSVSFGWKEGLEEIQNNYSLSFGNRKFEIVKRKRSLPINSTVAQKYYDGQPLRRSDITNKFIDTTGTDVNASEFDYFDCDILGVTDASVYPAEFIFESATDRITVKGNFVIKKVNVQLVTNQDRVKTYDGKPFTFNADEFTVKIFGTNTVLPALKVRSCEVTPVIDVEYNTNGTAAAQSVTLNRADIVLAGNGEIVREENIEYVQQSFDVTVLPKSLTFSINTANMKEGTYDPSSVLKIDGLVDGNEITYGEDVVVSALPNGYAVISLKESGKFVFTITDKGKEVTNNYKITQQEIYIPY